VVVLNVMAPIGQTFDGPPLRDALENAGLRAGDMQLYHYRAEGQPPDSQPIFSALNVIKPGTLPPQAFEGMRTPGVALVLRLPGPERPREAFELMYGTATGIAQELGGRLCDDTRSSLTGQALNHLRERIAELARRQRAGG
jgi:cell division protein ZipA